MSNNRLTDEQIKRELDRIEFLKRRRVDTWADHARAAKLNRELVEREWHRKNPNPILKRLGLA